MDRNRRAFLLGTAGLGGLLAVAARSRSAQAFSFEEMPPGSAVALAYSSRCAGSNDTGHAAILDRLQADLADQSGPAGSSVSAQEVCPICGCPIVATREF